jgi:MYXO-CTERM domain-containing protein
MLPRWSTFRLVAEGVTIDVKGDRMSRLTTALRAALIAALMTLGIVTGGAVAAQDATEAVEDTAGQVEETAQQADEEDEGFNDWGLFGLLGLAGLAGLFRRPQPVVHETGRGGFTGASDRIDNTGL